MSGQGRSAKNKVGTRPVPPILMERGVRQFDFSLVTPHPSESDIKASSSLWMAECQRLGLHTLKGCIVK